MRRFLLSTTVISLALCSAALSADLQPAAPVLKPIVAPVAYGPWSGVYGGFFAGGHWSKDRWTAEDINPPATFGAQTLKPDGFTGGVLLGANVQHGPWVWGVEADLGFFSGASTLVATGIPGTDIDSIESKMRWNAHARARLGYASGHWMPFVAGGLAYANTRSTMDAAPGFFGPFMAPTVSTETANRIGFSLGLGIDWMFSPNWIARVEYLHDRFADATSIHNRMFPLDDASTLQLHANIVRGAMIYKFGDAPVPAAMAPYGGKGPVYKAVAAISSAGPWSGIYTGVFAGGHWTRDNWSSEQVALDFNPKWSGFAVGLLRGANIQYGNAVWGVETDFGAATGSGQVDTALSLTPLFGPLLYPVFESEVRFNAHARLRFGYSFGQWMPFLAAGLAYANTRVTITYPPGGNGISSTMLHRLGFSFGGGIDWMFAPNWVGRIEYLHDRYAPAGFAVSRQVDATNVELTSNIVRGAVIYHLGAASPPLLAGIAPPAVPGAWAGVYAGLFAGGHWSKDRWQSDFNVAPFNFEVDGLAGGGLIGANFQHGNWVWGPEVDLGVLTGSATYANSPANMVSFDTRMRWGGHGRLRFGHAFGNFLPFLTTGVAYVSSRSTMIPAVGVLAPSTILSLNRIGYSIGGGLDWMFAPNWIGRVEYLHDRFSPVHFSDPGVSNSEYLQLTSNTVRGAIIYRFGVPAPAGLTTKN